METVTTIESRPIARDLIRGRSGLIVFGTALVSAALYIATPTRDYFWDGITFALQIDKAAATGRPELLFHQNHLIYNLFGYALRWFGEFAGLHVRTLSLLQVANSLIASVGIATFYTMVKRTARDRYAATVAAAFLGLGATWWKLATDADAYIAAVVLLIVCLNELLRDDPRYLTAGLAFGAAMLTHELSSLFSIALVTTAFFGRSDRRKKLLLTVGFSWTLTVTVYALCGFILYRISDPGALLRWVTSNPSRLPVQSNPFPGIPKSARANIDLIVGHSISSFLDHPGPTGWSLAGLAVLACAVVAVGAVTRLRRFRQTKVGLSRLHDSTHPVTLGATILSWILPYNIFLLFFEPQDAYLRLFYAPAIALALGLLVARYRRLPAEVSPRRVLAGSSAAAVAALALFNLAFFIEPHLRGESNPLVVAAFAAREQWDGRTVIYYAARNEADTTFEYFNEQTEWRKISNGSLIALDREIGEVLKQGGSVWLNSGAASLRGDELLQLYEIAREMRVDVSFAPARYIKIVPRSS